MQEERCVNQDAEFGEIDQTIGSHQKTEECSVENPIRFIEFRRMVHWLEQSLRNHEQKDLNQPSFGQRHDKAMFSKAGLKTCIIWIWILFIHEFP